MGGRKARAVDPPRAEASHAAGAHEEGENLAGGAVQLQVQGHRIALVPQYLSEEVK